MNNELMKHYIIDWFENGFTLKELMQIVLDVINSHEYKDH